MEGLGKDGAGWFECLDLRNLELHSVLGRYNRRSGQRPMLRPQAPRAESYLNLVGKGAKFKPGCLKRTKCCCWRA